jgi:hypothetical protein
MEVQEVGKHWWLIVGQRRLEFTHDGRGTVRMRNSDGRWLVVTPRWDMDQSLCWNSVCARGEIPLD